MFTRILLRRLGMNALYLTPVAVWIIGYELGTALQ